MNGDSNNSSDSVNSDSNYTNKICDCNYNCSCGSSSADSAGTFKTVQKPLVQPKLQPIPETGQYQLIQSYWFNRMGITLLIADGFKFDGASIPRFCWSMLGVTPFDPKVMLPAMIHDFIYTFHQYDRLTADIVFRDLCKLSGISDWDSDLMYKAVRIAGGSHW